MKDTHLLIIGLGGMGNKHLETFRKHNEIKLSIVEKDKSRFDNLENKKRILNFFQLIPESLDKFDGVVIATPPDTHKDITQLCIDQNIPFLLEKPLGSSTSGWQDLIIKSSKKGAKGLVAYPRRFGKGYKRLKEKITSKNFGEVFFVNSNFSQNFRKYRPDYADTYYALKKSGGGILLDAISHHLDLMVYLFGEIKNIKTKLKKVAILDTECEDFALTHIEFKNNNTIGFIQGNQFQKPNTDLIEIVGEKISIKYDRIKNKFSSSNNETWIDEEISGDWDKILFDQSKNFLNLIRGLNYEGTSLKEGLNILECIEKRKEI